MSRSSYRSLDSFVITGRGRVFMVQLPETDPAYGSPRTLRGKDVLIDDQLFTVVGVETYAVSDGHGALTGPCGLLVREEQ